MLKLTIKGWRAERNMSQTELAQAVGTTQKTISKWENGVAPRLDDIEKLRKVLNLKTTDHIIMPKDLT